MVYVPFGMSGGIEGSHGERRAGGDVHRRDSYCRGRWGDLRVHGRKQPPQAHACSWRAEVHRRYYSQRIQAGVFSLALVLDRVHCAEKLN